LPTVAVVIPTRNRRAPLLRALDSVRRQTQPPDELIVVDDASAPPIAEVLAGAPGIRLVVNRERLGGGGARNRGVASATSDLIAFLDSDDYWGAEKLARQHARFVARPELDLVYCDQYLLGPDRRPRPSGKTLISGDPLPHLLNFWTAPNTSTLMIRRTSFERLGGFDEALSSCQDHDLWMRIATHGLLVGCVPEPLSYFCLDQPARISRCAAQRMAGVEAFLAKWRDTITASAGERAFRRFRNEYYVAAAFRLFVEALNEHQLRVARQIFSQYLATNPALYRKAFRLLAAAVSPRPQAAS
jgi:glycosyltransferase involved in cell wall biosynthesis